MAALSMPQSQLFYATVCLMLKAWALVVDFSCFIIASSFIDFALKFFS
jgi:hypothetical protein